MRWAPGLAQYDWLIGRPIAHRGLHARAKGVIENTKTAFAAAMAAGYSIECDLQITRDGEAAVFHDDTLERLTTGRGRVDQLSMAELKALEIKSSRDRIQSLQELLQQVNGAVPLIIELKSHWNGDDRLARRAVDVLAGYQGPFALMSFDPELVAAVRHFAPTMPRGIVADRMTDPEWQMLPVARRLELRHFTHISRSLPHFIAYDVNGFPSPTVQRLRSAGVPVICWTVRNVATAQRAHRFTDQITFEGFLA